MEDELVIHNLSKNFRVDRREIQAFEGVDFSVPEGRFLCIVGPSGCGKSTLLRCIAGLETPSQGEITCGGKSIQKPSKDRMVVFQSFEQLFPWLTVLGNVTYALQVTNERKPQKDTSIAATREENARKYLNLVGLTGYENFFPHQLSGGMKQRVAIARALAVQPRFLLMDEPFGSLDAFSRSILQEELLRIWQETKTTILFVTHSIEESIILSEQIIVFSSSPGKVKAIINNDLERPRYPETSEFMGLWKRLNELLGLHPKTTAQPVLRHRTLFDEAEVIQPIL
ncbi:MAG TPA: nitrate ABC transporter substrate-binding protein [Firmicutes bacterium]|jgi:NitT/TauT family transport system ATP-binding protein|nr:nitrate ABC transporter substrate-binding protein [Bacillota bacterium]